MNSGKAELSSVLNVPATRVYSILADYRVGHPAILPKKYFKKLEVEEGGRGAGTKLYVQMQVAGATKSFRHFVSEPEPGRVLVEADADGATVTTFTVDPMGDGSSCRLTIGTKFPVRDGIIGTIERFFTSRVLRVIYAKEIAQLADYVGSTPT